MEKKYLFYALGILAAMVVNQYVRVDQLTQKFLPAA